MRECKNCKVTMIENAEVMGQHPSEHGVDSISNIYVSYTNGEKEVKGLFGKIKKEEAHYAFELKARVCPNCGNVELYVNLDENESID